MSDRKSSVRRTRNFATVVYPESAPENWINILSEQFIPAFISPVHNLDCDDMGNIKKPHYHVLIMFDSVKTIEQATEVFNIIGGVGCEIVQSIRGYARYLCHLDNDDKTRYDISNVVSLSGANYNSVISLISDRYVVLGDIQDFCDRYDVSSFYMLAKYARKNKPDWYKVVCDNSIFFREYLKSRHWSIENNFNTIIDPETGESLV